MASRPHPSPAGRFNSGLQAATLILLIYFCSYEYWTRQELNRKLFPPGRRLGKQRALRRRLRPASRPCRDCSPRRWAQIAVASQRPRPTEELTEHATPAREVERGGRQGNRERQRDRGGREREKGDGDGEAGGRGGGGLVKPLLSGKRRFVGQCRHDPLLLMVLKPESKAETTTLTAPSN